MLAYRALGKDLNPHTPGHIATPKARIPFPFHDAIPDLRGLLWVSLDAHLHDQAVTTRTLFLARGPANS